MKYNNITVKKYQIINHIINTYAENHDNMRPSISYDKEAQVLEITGISKPISFNAENIGIIPKGAYEVVGQVIRSKTDDGHVDLNGMRIYDSAQRIFNITSTDRQSVFDFIAENSKSSYCACCDTNRERSKLFYIRRVDASNKLYQVGSRCVKQYFDTSYFDLMKNISNVIELDEKSSAYKFSDYNVIDYLTLYYMFSKVAKNIKSCCKKVLEVIDSGDDISKTRWGDEFSQQKAANIDKIITIAKFYNDYPDYSRNDNILAIKTIQSMAEMLQGSIDIDPYYSKSNCLNIAKMYTSLLSDYASDYRKYSIDLFKYNAYLAESELNELWKANNHTSYYLNFELDIRRRNISYRVYTSPTRFSKHKAIALLTAEGNMVDANKAKSELLDLVSKVNASYGNESQKSNLLVALVAYKDECLRRYSHFKPAIIYKHDGNSIIFSDYTNDPLVINLSEDIESAKLKLSTFVNMSYMRQKINTAYKQFLNNYIGKLERACMQPKELNLQFSCEYAKTQFILNWPNKQVLPNISCYIDAPNKNVIIFYEHAKASLKMPVNAIGIISGADYDISIRIQTFISRELGLEMPKVKKERIPKTDEDIVKARPKKNVIKLFSSLDASAKNLVALRRVNVLNDISSKSIGVTVPDIGKILFTVDSGAPICENDMYRGRISLAGRVISDNKRFDKKTFINAVHALEYLVYLSDESGNSRYSYETVTTKSYINHIYKYNVAFGNCSGTLQFRIVECNGKCTLKYSPKLVIEKMLGDVKVSCSINPNFSQECWNHIQEGILHLSDIQRGSKVFDGQKNQNLISGLMWIDGGDSQKISNEMFTKLTGIRI